MLMPSHAKNVKLYRDTQPIFTRYGIESQLDAMFSPVDAAALRRLHRDQPDRGAGRDRRQFRAAPRASTTSRTPRSRPIWRPPRRSRGSCACAISPGLIVIDFIDMDEKRNNRAVERRLKECLRHDRARIQVGHISHFGLLEMSRQRIRSSVLESSTEKCPHCGGTGHVRSVSSVALQLLRSLEEMLLKGATHNLIVRTRTEIALYLLNHKRAHLRALEERFRIIIMVNADATIGGQVSFVIEKGEQVHSLEQAKALALQPAPAVPAPIERGRGRRRRGRGGGRRAERRSDRRRWPTPDRRRAVRGRARAGPAAEQRPDGGRDGRKRRRRRRGRRGGERREAPAGA